MDGVRFLLLCSILVTSWSAHRKQALAAPQDMKTAMLMAVAQIKDSIDNGAAARDEKNFEIAGVKFQNKAEVGWGDAMKGGRRRRRDADEDENENENESTSSSSSSSGSSESLPTSSEYYDENSEQ